MHSVKVQYYEICDGLLKTGHDLIKPLQSLRASCLVWVIVSEDGILNLILAKNVVLTRFGDDEVKCTW